MDTTLDSKNATTIDEVKTPGTLDSAPECPNDLVVDSPKGTSKESSESQIPASNNITSIVDNAEKDSSTRPQEMNTGKPLVSETTPVDTNQIPDQPTGEKPARAETLVETTAEKKNTVETKPPRKKTKKKQLPPSKPVDLVGLVDTIEGFAAARQELNTRVVWFQENPIPSTLELKDIEVPPDLDWDDGKAVHAAFPPWKLENGKLLGTRQIPRCFLLDAKTPHEKLLVMNWWKNMTKEQQADVVSKENIHRFYRAPMRSNSPYKYWHDGPEGKGGNTASVEKRETSYLPRHSFGAPILLKKPDVPTLGFRMARNCQDLSNRFKLSIAQLYCASLEPNMKCSVETCQYPAFQHNRNLCCVHKQNWWPRYGLEHHQKRRGHLLLGVEYAVRPTKDDIPTLRVRVRPVPCGCSDPTCEGIGWSADMARVPKNFALPDTIVPNSHRDKDRPVRLAPWHFPPQYRLQLPDGTWKLTLEGKTTSDKFPSPTYDPKDFLKEPGMIEYMERKSPYLLPDWVFALRAKEEGPMTLEELQVHSLVQQRNALLQRLLWQSVEHHELSHEHQQAETKLEEMKKIQSHRRHTSLSAADATSLAKQTKQAKRKRGGNNTPLKKRRTENVAFLPVNDLSSGDEMSEDGVHRAAAAAAAPGRAQPQEQQQQQPRHALHHLPPRGHAIHQSLPAPPQYHHLQHPPEAQGTLQHHYSDDTGAMHEGAQAIQFLQHQATTAAAAAAAAHHHHHHHAVHPHQQQQQQPQQQSQHQAPHNSAFYPVLGGDTLGTSLVRGAPPATTDLVAMRRWGYGAYR